MHNSQQFFSFICNPAASMHHAWKKYLPEWGIPDALCQPLWEQRSQNGKLTRFLDQRFDIGINTISEIKKSPYLCGRQIFISKGEMFENGIMQIGALFLYKQALQIIDGESLRLMQKELGKKNYHFIRYKAQSFMQKNAINVKSITTTKISKQNLLLFGLAALLKILPHHEGLITRLCLKISPLDKEPRPPKTFSDIQDHIKNMKTFPSLNTVKKIFVIEGETA